MIQQQIETSNLSQLAADVLERLDTQGIPEAAFATALACAVRQRKRKQRKALVHAECIRLALAQPELPINHDFFERVSDAPGVTRSGSVCESLYYEALRDGLRSVHQVRANP